MSCCIWNFQNSIEILSNQKHGILQNLHLLLISSGKQWAYRFETDLTLVFLVCDDFELGAVFWSQNAVFGLKVVHELLTVGSKVCIGIYIVMAQETYSFPIIQCWEWVDEQLANRK